MKFFEAYIQGTPDCDREGEFEVPKFELSTNSHRMQCLEFNRASPSLHKMIREIVMNNYIDHPEYKFNKESGAFLQGGCDLKSGWIMIEFWNLKVLRSGSTTQLLNGLDSVLLGTLWTSSFWIWR